MFGLFKKKKSLPTFAPLVTDMHCHLLPLVDDGSKSLEESLEVMEAMREVGYEQIRLTPHFSYPRYPNEEGNIQERYKYFCEEVAANSEGRQLPRMTSITGEYQIDEGFREHVESGKLLTYRFTDSKEGAEKGILLVEFSLHHKRMGMDEAIFSRLMDGYDVILAHPERYPYLDGQSPMMEQMKEQGVYFQVNVLSLDGFYGEEARRKAFEYIENGWVEFLGSDMHNVMYAEALRHASLNKKIIKLMETTEFENKKLAVK
jgi:tyrosine-protein phosphatase YwqE